MFKTEKEAPDSPQLLSPFFIFLSFNKFYKSPHSSLVTLDMFLPNRPVNI